MKILGWAVLALILGLTSAKAGAGTFDNLQQNADYLRVRRACVPAAAKPEAISAIMSVAAINGFSIISSPSELRRSLSFISLQGEFLNDSAVGGFEGLKSALTLRDPGYVNPTVARKWESMPFFIGLLDCLGSDPLGFWLSRTLLYEMIVGYAIENGLAWGIPLLTGASLFRVIFRSIFNAYGYIQMTRMMALGLVAWQSPKMYLVYQIHHRQTNERAETQKKIVASELSATGTSPLTGAEEERRLDFERTLISTLNEKLKDCKSFGENTCSEIRETIARLNRHLEKI